MATNKHSEKHHYVPKGVLRNFRFKGDTVYFADKVQPQKGVRGIQERNINNIFFKRHVNSFLTVDGRRDDTAEIELARKVDDRIAKVVREIRQNPKERLSPEQKEVLARYLVSRTARLPSLRDVFWKELNIEASIEVASQRVGLGWEEIRDRIFLEDAPESLGDYLYASVAAIQDQNSLDLFMDSAMAVASPEREGSFLLGDVPMIGQVNELSLGYPKQFEIWTVVAPEVMIGFIHRDDVDHTVQFNVTLCQNAMRAANEDIARRSSMLVSGDVPSIEQAISSIDFFIDVDRK